MGYKTKKTMYRYLVVVTTVTAAVSLLWTLVICPFIHRSPLIFTAEQYYIANLPSDTKFVLYWNTFFGKSDMWLGMGREVFGSCEYSNCYATNNRSMIRTEFFDAIIFHAVGYNTSDAPMIRLPHQVYVFYAMENPMNARLHPSIGFYNWTMSYHADSDIVRPYGSIEEDVTGYVLPEATSVRKKSRMVAWFVSNCNSLGTNRRMEYVNELKRYVDVDIYGACGTLSCTKSENNNACLKMIEEKYYFVLAFENAVCEDYVTEKMWEPLFHNVVPIVLGGADYKNIAPPNSVINIDDYSSPRKLAVHLRWLTRNVDEYLKYFQWKENYNIDMSSLKAVCDLCKKLHQPLSYSYYKDIRAWYNSHVCNA